MWEWYCMYAVQMDSLNSYFYFHFILIFIIILTVYIYAVLVLAPYISLVFFVHVQGSEILI